MIRLHELFLQTRDDAERELGRTYDPNQANDQELDANIRNRIFSIVFPHVNLPLPPKVIKNPSARYEKAWHWKCYILQEQQRADLLMRWGLWPWHSDGKSWLTASNWVIDELITLADPVEGDTVLEICERLELHRTDNP